MRTYGNSRKRKPDQSTQSHIKVEDVNSGQRTGYQSNQTLSQDYGNYNNTLFLTDEEMGYKVNNDNLYQEPKRPRKNIWSKIIWWVCVFGCIGALLFCGWQVWSIFDRTTLPTEVVNSILKDDEDGKIYLRLDWAKLKETYPEIVAWIYIPNTGVNYPIVQHTGEDKEHYYLEHGAQMEPNDMGAIFLDGNADPSFQDDNTMIYGHSVEYYGGMFTGLNRFMTEEHFYKNPYIYLITPEHTYRADIRLVANTTDGTDYYLTSYGNWDENILQWQLDNSAHNREDVELKRGSHLITLSTCDLRNGSYTDRRYVLQGKLEYYMDDVEYIDDDKTEFLRRMSGILTDSLGSNDVGKEGVKDAE